MTDRADAGEVAAGTSPLAEPPRSLAIVRLSALGDTVHVLPLLASFRRAWPECRIAWAIQPGPLELMRGRPDVDEFFVFPRERGLRGVLEFRSRVRGRHFDLVLDCHRHFKAGIVTALLRAPVKVGFDRRRARDLTWLTTTHRLPPRPGGHVQDQYFEFLEYLGVPVVREWDFWFTEAERADQRTFFDRLDGPALAVVLCSSRREKDWTLEGYARVLEQAESELGLRAILVGGRSPREERAATRLKGRTRARVVDARADDLRRLAWLLDGSALALAPDTGPLHIAVALKTPTVGLYGATDPARSGPYGRFGELVVYRPEGTAQISVGEVAEKLEEAVRRYLGRGGAEAG